VKRKQAIVYWAFNIDIVGPRYETIVDRQNARKILSKRLGKIEKAALLATKGKLPPGFRAILS
jgi:hypothetical protein